MNKKERTSLHGGRLPAVTFPETWDTRMGDCVSNSGVDKC